MVPLLDVLAPLAAEHLHAGGDAVEPVGGEHLVDECPSARAQHSCQLSAREVQVGHEAQDVFQAVARLGQDASVGVHAEDGRSEPPDKLEGVGAAAASEGPKISVPSSDASDRTPARTVAG